MSLTQYVYKIVSCLCIIINCWCLQDDQAYHLNDHYYVCISPEFKSWQLESIDRGMGLWNELGETRFYSGDGNLCNLLVSPATGRVATNIEKDLDDPEILGYADTAHTTIYLFVDKVFGSKDLTYLMAHEADHWIGLRHISMDRLAVMNPFRRYYGFGPPHLFRADLEQYCRLWTCKTIDWDHADNVIYSIPDAGVKPDLDTAPREVKYDHESYF